MLNLKRRKNREPLLPLYETKISRPQELVPKKRTNSLADLEEGFAGEIDPSKWKIWQKKISEKLQASELNELKISYLPNTIRKSLMFIVLGGMVGQLYVQQNNQGYSATLPYKETTGLIVQNAHYAYKQLKSLDREKTGIFAKNINSPLNFLVGIGLLFILSVPMKLILKGVLEKKFKTKEKKKKMEKDPDKNKDMLTVGQISETIFINQMSQLSENELLSQMRYNMEQIKASAGDNNQFAKKIHICTKLLESSSNNVHIREKVQEINKYFSEKKQIDINVVVRSLESLFKQKDRQTSLDEYFGEAKGKIESKSNRDILKDIKALKESMKKFVENNKHITKGDKSILFAKRIMTHLNVVLERCPSDALEAHIKKLQKDLDARNINSFLGRLNIVCIIIGKYFDNSDNSFPILIQDLMPKDRKGKNAAFSFNDQRLGESSQINIL